MDNNFKHEIQTLEDLAKKLKEKQSDFSELNDIKDIEQVRANIHAAFLILTRLNKRLSDD